MDYFFSALGNCALYESLTKNTLLALDFDGTLVPICNQPHKVFLQKETSDLLSSISKLIPVGIISGRSIQDLQNRIGFEPNFMVGSHGAECKEYPESLLNKLKSLNDTRKQIQRHKKSLDDSGITTEDKDYSIALHYRNSKDKQNALLSIHQLLSSVNDEINVFGGKDVVNVVSKSAPNKADAIKILLRKFNHANVIFAGDDINDEPVFESAKQDWLTLYVGNQHHNSKAQFYIRNPEETLQFLKQILCKLSTSMF